MAYQVTPSGPEVDPAWLNDPTTQAELLDHDPFHWLPMWRWTTVKDMWTDWGGSWFTRAIKGAISGSWDLIIETLFLIAGLLWLILGACLKVIFYQDVIRPILNSAQGVMDDILRHIGVPGAASEEGAVLWAYILVVGLIVSGWHIIRRGPREGLRTGTRVAIPLILLMVMVGPGAAGSTDEENEWGIPLDHDLCQVSGDGDPINGRWTDHECGPLRRSPPRGLYMRSKVDSNDPVWKYYDKVNTLVPADHNKCQIAETHSSTGIWTDIACGELRQSITTISYAARSRYCRNPKYSRTCSTWTNYSGPSRITSPGGISKPGQAALRIGSAAWIYDTATYFAESAALPFVVTLGQVVDKSGKEGNTYCHEMMAALEEIYRQDLDIEAKSGQARGLSFLAGHEYRKEMPVILSRLWTYAYLYNYGAAQLGPGVASHRGVCLLAEARAGNPPTETLFIWDSTAAFPEVDTLAGSVMNRTERDLEEGVQETLLIYTLNKNVDEDVQANMARLANRLQGGQRDNDLQQIIDKLDYTLIGLEGRTSEDEVNLMGLLEQAREASYRVERAATEVLATDWSWEAGFSLKEEDIQNLRDLGQAINTLIVAIDTLDDYANNVPLVNNLIEEVGDIVDYFNMDNGLRVRLINIRDELAPDAIVNQEYATPEDIARAIDEALPLYYTAKARSVFRPEEDIEWKAALILWSACDYSSPHGDRLTENPPGGLHSPRYTQSAGGTGGPPGPWQSKDAADNYIWVDRAWRTTRGGDGGQFLTAEVCSRYLVETFASQDIGEDVGLGDEDGVQDPSTHDPDEMKAWRNAVESGDEDFFNNEVGVSAAPNGEEIDGTIQATRIVFGLNMSHRVIHALLALILAAMFFRALLGLTFGTLVAQFLLGLSIMLMPFALLVMAMPFKALKHFPRKIFTLLLASAGSVMIFTFTLLLTLYIIQIATDALISVTDPGSWAQALSMALVPLVAFKMVAAMGKQFGLDINSFKGALAATSGIALAAVGTGAAGQVEGYAKRGWSRAEHMVRGKVAGNTQTPPTSNLQRQSPMSSLGAGAVAGAGTSLLTGSPKGRKTLGGVGGLGTATQAAGGSGGVKGMLQGVAAGMVGGAKTASAAAKGAASGGQTPTQPDAPSESGQPGAAGSGPSPGLRKAKGPAGVLARRMENVRAGKEKLAIGGMAAKNRARRASDFYGVHRRKFTAGTLATIGAGAAVGAAAAPAALLGFGAYKFAERKYRQMRLGRTGVKLRNQQLKNERQRRQQGRVQERREKSGGGKVGWEEVVPAEVVAMQQELDKLENEQAAQQALGEKRRAEARDEVESEIPDVAAPDPDHPAHALWLPGDSTWEEHRRGRIEERSAEVEKRVGAAEASIAKQEDKENRVFVAKDGTRPPDVQPGGIVQADRRDLRAKRMEEIKTQLREREARLAASGGIESAPRRWKGPFRQREKPFYMDALENEDPE